MRIDRLEIENFRKFSRQRFDFHPRFTLLAGDNGSGKTTVLEALAVAAGIWLVEPPDSTLANSRREISRTEIRLEPRTEGDRTQFQERLPVAVRATGNVAGQEPITWTRQIRAGGRRTTNADAQGALSLIRDVYRKDAAGERGLCPVIASYGAGRAWLPSNEGSRASKANGAARRWAAFHDCFRERIRFGELNRWFRNESIERWNRGGEWRPGFRVARDAVIRCVPGASDLSYDPDRDQVVMSIGGHAQPFDNLSAGQRMMLALVADLAIKAVTQNAFLLAPGKDPERLLAETPGIVLIDEIDVHLHPKWQRRVAADLKRTFPSIQFVCTSHSPQVIGELEPSEILLLGEAAALAPPRSYGVDSNRVLAELMDARPRNEEVEAMLGKLFRSIDEEDFPAARAWIDGVAQKVGVDDPELTRARALIRFLESGS